MADPNKIGLSVGCKEMLIDFGEICRFCLTETKSDLTINGACFCGDGRESEGESICSFMMKLGLIKMEDPKIFPSQVCRNCYQSIQICYNFYQNSQKSHNLLRNCYESTLNQSITKMVISKDSSNNKQENVKNSCDSFPTDVTDHEQDESVTTPITQTQNSALTQLISAHTDKNQNCEQLMHSCSQCSLKFKNAGALNFHFVATHSQRHYRTSLKFQCKICTKLFNDEDKLKRHYKMSHKIMEMTRELLNNSVRQIIQFEKRKFFCFHCVPYREFQSKDQLTEHLENFHKTESSKTVSKLFVDEISEKNVKCLPHYKSSKLSQCEVNKSLKNADKEMCQNLEVLSGVVQDGKDFKILCQKCNPPLEFTSVNDFAQHVRTHRKKKGGWNCSECPAKYSRKQTLHWHMKEKHKSVEGLKCPEPDCLETFGSNRQLILHGISSHQKYFAYFHKAFKKIAEPEPEVEEEEARVKNFECDICQRKYIYKSSLRKHIQVVHLGKSKDSVDCPHCGKMISSRLNLKSHIEFVHEALIVSCPICKKKINFRAIGKHYKTHKTTSQLVLSKSSFLCNLCGKILKSKRSFQDHQKLHWNVRDEICDVCGRGFTTKKFLQLHKKIHEGVQRKTHPCDKCEKVFSGKHTLNRHLLTHSGKKNFICEICSKCFYTLQELNRHVRYHKKEYRFDCQLCEMRFLDKSRFRHHMMRHRNVRPHKCQFCEKMFIVRGKMNLHMANKHNFHVQDRKGVWKDPKTYVPLDDLL